MTAEYEPSTYTYRNRDLLPPVIHTLSEQGRVTVASKRAASTTLRGMRDVIVLNTRTRAFAIVTTDAGTDTDGALLDILILASKTICACSQGQPRPFCSGMVNNTTANHTQLQYTRPTQQTQDAIETVGFSNLIAHIRHMSGTPPVAYGVDFKNPLDADTFTIGETIPGQIILFSRGLEKGIREYCTTNPRRHDSQIILLDVAARKNDSSELAEHLLSLGQSRNGNQYDDHSVIIWDTDPL